MWIAEPHPRSRHHPKHRRCYLGSIRPKWDMAGAAGSREYRDSGRDVENKAVQRLRQRRGEGRHVEVIMSWRRLDTRTRLQPGASASSIGRCAATDTLHTTSHVDPFSLATSHLNYHGTFLYATPAPDIWNWYIPRVCYSFIESYLRRFWCPVSSTRMTLNVNQFASIHCAMLVARHKS